MFGRVEQLSYKRSSGQAAISWLRGEHSAPHDSWRLAKWLSCQLLASYLSKQVCDQLSYMVKHSIRAATLSATLWPSAHRRQISSGAARSVARDVVLCTVTRVQTKEKTATRARKHRGGQPAVITRATLDPPLSATYMAHRGETQKQTSRNNDTYCVNKPTETSCVCCSVLSRSTRRSASATLSRCPACRRRRET